MGTLTLVLVGALCVGFCIVAQQWENYRRSQRVLEGVEASGPVGRYQLVRDGDDWTVLLDTSTGQLWRKPSGDLMVAWEGVEGPPVPGRILSTPSPTSYGKPSSERFQEV